MQYEFFHNSKTTQHYYSCQKAKKNPGIFLLVQKIPMLSLLLLQFIRSSLNISGPHCNYHFNYAQLFTPHWECQAKSLMNCLFLNLYITLDGVMDINFKFWTRFSFDELIQQKGIFCSYKIQNCSYTSMYSHLSTIHDCYFYRYILPLMETSSEAYCYLKGRRRFLCYGTK